jgi:DNA-binding GntR family transcriptional regulator
MEHYRVPGLNTIRQARQLLVDDGLVETRQGRRHVRITRSTGPTTG